MPDQEFQDGEILTAEGLNNMRVGLTERIEGHTHTGGQQGLRLEAGALADGAVGSAQLQAGSITEPKLDPTLYRSLKDGPTTRAFLKATTSTIPLVVDAQPIGPSSAPRTGMAIENLSGVTLTGLHSMVNITGATDAGTAVRLASLAGNLSMIENIDTIGRIDDFIGNPALLLPEWSIQPSGSSNVKAIYRKKSGGDSSADPSTIRIDFTKAYTGPDYLALVTPEWGGKNQPLLVVKRDRTYLELSVPTGKYADLRIDFNLAIFGDLTP